MQDGQLIIRNLGRQDYSTVWHAMQEYTDNRDAESVDELWVVEHTPVFTQGQAGKSEHILAPGDIPVIQVDRGGQVTYHGPGQLVVYPLIDIKRLRIGVRQLVNTIEQSIVDLLKPYGIEAYPKADAPGVYVSDNKIASLGLRIRKGCSFHGLALNVNMDMEPFHRINPCGYAGLQMIQCNDLNGPKSVQEAGDKLVHILSGLLGYKQLVQYQGLAE
ncbi:lipoyl(octanoyl) transferase LipB [Parashewanella spongiae]|uniref:Octanoyltransferase n=1 Tax=Parashewanella spongiae TaxID=342950 RepID=A0A3A6TXK2_9GAMM|nr:lipoyl(octanoyl) transferase LipB [Parashewanella spongiae]MCL1079931.1 lipoyl(octanoyl) transferase LipB [Parashewanella spongiae]RJY06208.1 lipoyl(octanoyl) transferase LipB [Parashewanella spongiae]